MTDKLLYRVPEAAEAMGGSRTKAYDLVARGIIPVVRFDGSVRIPVESLRRWIAQQTKAPYAEGVRNVRRVTALAFT